MCYICNNCKCYRRNSKEANMRKTPKITEAEWEVMKVLWGTSPATANDIVKRLSGKTHWKRMHQGRNQDVSEATRRRLD